MQNSELAKILREIGEYLEMEGAAFKPQAYARAALSVENLEEPVLEMYQKGGLKMLEEIPGVGRGIAEKIEEFLKTGRIKEYEKLKKAIPVDLTSLSQIEGLGPKSIGKLYQKLKIQDLKGLEKAAQTGEIRGLEGFGRKSEEKILKGIEFLKDSGKRFLLSAAETEAREIENSLLKLKEVQKCVTAGSFRRRKETIGDIDILAVSEKPEVVADFFISLPIVDYVYGKGKTKSMVRLKSGIDADLRIVTDKSYGAALNYFTGSKEHNIALREIAIKKGYKLNEYGLFKGEKKIAGLSEEELYEKLGLDYIEPELRENTGEIQAAMKHSLPKLIGYNDLKGDTQMHTSWSASFP